MIEKTYIDALKKVPIGSYLASLGYIPTRQSGPQLVYFSPLSIEKTPSFFVHLTKNVFHCFSTGHKGDNITLMRLLKKTTFQEALDELTKFSAIAKQFEPFPFQISKPESEIEIIRLQPLKNEALINYLASRGVSAHLGKRYLQEAHFKVSGKQLFALALQNDKDGYELRNAFYKGCTITKASTTVHGSAHLKEKYTETVNIFEGFFDFLSALTYYKTDNFKNDTLILSSLWLFDAVCQQRLLNSYQSFNLFLDNDRAGLKKAIEFRNRVHQAKGDKNKVKNYSSLYKGYKDFNDFLIKQP